MSKLLYWRYVRKSHINKLYECGTWKRTRKFLIILIKHLTSLLLILLDTLLLENRAQMSFVTDCLVLREFSLSRRNEPLNSRHRHNYTLVPTLVCHSSRVMALFLIRPTTDLLSPFYSFIFFLFTKHKVHSIINFVFITFSKYFIALWFNQIQP
jgi:hypothetical protein